MYKPEERQFYKALRSLFETPSASKLLEPNRLAIVFLIHYRQYDGSQLPLYESEISEILGMDLKMVSRHIRVLERDGYVKRAPKAILKKGRPKMKRTVRLTEKGTKNFEGLIPNLSQLRYNAHHVYSLT